MESNAWIWLVTCILLLNTDSLCSERSTGSEEDIIIPGLGAKIEKIGEVVSTDDDILISILVKLPNLTRIAYPDENDPTIKNIITLCSDPYLHQHVRYSDGTTTGHAFLSNLKNVLKHYRSAIQDYINNRYEILKPFVTPSMTEGTSHNQVRKRSILTWLSSTALSLAIGGFTEVQIYKINQHLKDNQQDLESLKSAILNQREMLHTLNDKVVGFIKDITSNLSDIITHMKCVEFLSSLTQRIQHEFDETVRIIDDTLWTALSGQNSLLLTPRMLDLEMLKYTINQNEMLQKTVFVNKPSFLYSISRLSLIELEKNLNYAHFVLQIPLITNTDFVSLFKVSQVGIYAGDNTCVYHKFPTYVYKKNNEFLPITMEHCQRHSELHVCPTENFSNETACIQQNANNCKTLKERCLNFYQFRMSQVGILLRNNKKDDTFSVDLQDLTSKVELNVQRTAYIYWQNVKSVQVGNKKILSPIMKNVSLIMSNLSLNVPELNLYLDYENVTNVFSDICNRYNSSLKDILTPVIFNSRSSSTGSTLLIAFILLLICVLAAWLGYLQYQVRMLNALISPSPLQEYSFKRLQQCSHGNGRSYSF